MFPPSRSSYRTRTLAASCPFKQATSDAPLKTVFYMRTWTIEVGQLVAILHHWSETGYRCAVAGAWTERLRGIQTTSSQTIFIRYIGKTAKVSGWQRMKNDPRLRKSGQLHAFHVALMTMCPEVIKPVSVSESWVASLLGSVDSQLADDQERLIIRLFHIDSLLNSQTRGSYMSYSPSTTDRHLFCAPYTVVHKGDASYLLQVFASLYLPESGVFTRGNLDGWVTGPSLTWALLNDFIESSLYNQHPYFPELLILMRSGLTASTMRVTARLRCVRVCDSFVVGRGYRSNSPDST